MLQSVEEVVVVKSASAPRLRRPPRGSGEELRVEELGTEEVQEDLKPERVQEGLRSEQVREALRSLPGWRMTTGVRGIDQIRTFPAACVAAAYGEFVLTFAAAAGQLCSVVQTHEHVTVTLSGRKGRGFTNVTRAVLDFAKRLG
ncbi:MAG TPA: hypothetical protein VGH73_04800 [Thermoanaerobaculia bacterium]|jgi:hypothetical protein